MRRATRWRPQPAMGSAKGTGALQQPAASLLDVSTPEWRALIGGRPNLLLMGAHSATDAMLSALAPYLRTPLYAWSGEPELPLHDDLGTLVLHDVGALGVMQQAELFDWLERSQQRVVSMTAHPLFTLVEGGEFRADLYYRLNMVLLEAV